MTPNPDIYREQVAYLLRQSPVTIAVNGSVTLFTSIILWHHTADLWLFAWMMMQLAIIAATYLLWRRSVRRARLPQSFQAGRPRRRLRMPTSIFLGLLSGASWGTLVFFLPALPPAQGLALLIILVGMASGASTNLAAIPSVALSFILADMAPIIIYFFLQGTLTYSALGAMSMIYTLAQLFAARTMYAAFLESSQNRRENAALLEQIRQERAVAEASLLQSEERYSEVVENVGDMIVSTEPEGKFLFINRAWYDRLGYTQADVENLTFRATLHPEYLTQSIDHVRRVLLRESTDPVELVLKKKNGQPVWVEGNINPLFENDKLVRIRGIFRDISLRKEAEQLQHDLQTQLQVRVTEATRELAETNTSLQMQIGVRRQVERAWRNSETQLRLILDSTVEAIYGVDRNGLCTFANAACAHFLGYEDTAELLGANMHALTHFQSPDDCTICAVNKIQGREHADNQNFKRRDSGLFPVEYSASSIMRDGQVIGGVVAFLDITQRRSAEEQLHQSQKMEAIGQLTGGIAHDFNNLLAIIVGNLDLLTASFKEQQAYSREKGRKHAEAALRASERAAALTQRLLSFSRKKMLTPEIISIRELIRNMTDLIPRVVGEDIKLEVRSNASSAKIFVDISQAENALLNLLINARDAMQGKGVLQSEVTLRKFDQPFETPRLSIPAGEYARFSVRDTGKGIAPEILDKVFEPFFTTKDEGLGTGLGLSMVHSFVTQANGYIHIESQPGVGTEVVIYLPIAAAEMIAAAQTGQSLDAGAVSADATPAASRLILVAEDDPDVRLTSVAQLQELGYSVLSAADGTSAIALFTANPGIDLLYSDVMMPNGMSGPVLAQHIRALKPEIKVLYCTGYDSSGALLSAESNAIVLQKPVRKDTLAARLKEVLGS